ncbi:uncharacterized protein LOC111366774 [Olea europaea var. sylvestris]|uniref:uncharacterized protein LOC111366774 n=1 Tax=Olea europaea var. sylvestris TaxID=158386 RepID=UPI000C1CCCD0|nr:uncharacterized protein LOC111366774 [Olea europaea var. sylvestris]
MNQKISANLAEVGPEKWSRTHVPTMTSNIVESVNVVTKTCTCRMLQVDLLPCPHALVVITNAKRDPYTFCYYYYTRDAYLNPYKDSIYPIGNPSEWTLPKEVLHEIVLALNQKRSCRRPTEKRKRSSKEGKPSVKCGHCGGHGHNRRRCSSLVPLS